MSSSKRGSLVSVLNGGVAAALVLALAVVALAVNPPAPPGIAELLPRATKPISKAPLGQTAGSAPGTGPCAGQASCAPSPLPRPSTSAQASGRPPQGVPSALSCYEWPDGSVTQTFDPQSPPCVAAWPEADKGNGGATSPGVTGSEIRVSIGAPLPGAAVHETSDTAAFRGLTEFFNRHFQLYGRKLVLVSHAIKGASSDPSSQRATALKAKELGVFAAIHGMAFADSTTNDDSTFLTTLASRKVIGINSLSTGVTEKSFEALKPYAWSYPPTFDDVQLNAAEFVCRALVGRVARYAGDAPLRGQTRSFVVLHPRPNDGPRLDVAPLLDALRACGHPTEAVEYVGHPQGASRSDTQNNGLLLDLKTRGTTTVVATGSSQDLAGVMSSASRVGYHPEWFHVPVAMYAAYSHLTTPPDEHAGLFGIAYWNKALPRSSSIPFRAFDEVDQGRTRLYTWGYTHDAFYKALLLLASGIQAAGPRLTPETFAAALQEVRFANPEKGGEPHFQGTVGLADDRAMVNDFGLWWYRSSEPNYDGSVGSGNYCYARRGQRFGLGTWPRDDAGLFVLGAKC